MSTAAPARRAPYNPQFLREIHFVQVRLEFEALDDVLLPPFPGSALRGVLGHALRDALCSCQGRCESGCVEPAACRYFALFERDRDSEGGNLPKSMILDPPVPEELAAIAAGGPVTEPYRATSGLGLDPPRLTNEYGNLVSAGEAFRTGLTLLGQAAALLPVVIEAVSLATMRIGAGRFVLHRVTDTGLGGRLLWSRRARAMQGAVPQSLAPLVDFHEPVSRLAIHFITPVRLKTSEGYCFSADSLAKHFWESALVRAMRVRDAFCAGGRERLPWMDIPGNWEGHQPSHVPLRIAAVEQPAEGVHGFRRFDRPRGIRGRSDRARAGLVCGRNPACRAESNVWIGASPMRAGIVAPRRGEDRRRVGLQTRLPPRADP